MQYSKGVGRPVGASRLRSRFAHAAVTFFAIISTAFLLVGSSLKISQNVADASPDNHVVPNNGSDRWTDDAQTTLPAFDFSPSDKQKASISPLFTGYYNSHVGVKNLGTPLTVAFPTNQGWVQFFTMGALMLPTGPQENTYDDVSEDHDMLTLLAASGVSDPDTRIVRLPLSQALLTAGSQEPLGGSGSSLTYVDLRAAANPDLMRPAPAQVAASIEDEKIFMKGGTRGNKDVGHLIPLPIWSYIQRADISPDGWEADFGAPLTEALSFTTTQQGSFHQMQVQVFLRDIVVMDQSGPAPDIQRLMTGVDYLRTIGPPSIFSSQKTVWVQSDITLLLKAPVNGQEVAHVGLHFPLTLLGDSSWQAGVLWYHVQWALPKSKVSGWVSAANISFASPGNVPGWASMDALSPDLASYLSDIGGSAGVSLYDVTRQRYYTYNANVQFTMASSIKVPIMLAFLDMIEQQGRQPTDTEMNLLIGMIEHSDNDAASALYDEVGDAAGVTDFLQRKHISGMDLDNGAWGYSQATPQSMIDLLAALNAKKILNDQDRRLAFDLMGHVETGQQAGVGDTAPDGAIVAMKNGWVPGLDGLWAVNSSGIVQAGSEAYIIAVYTQDQSSQGDGEAITQHVCGTVASLLV